MITTEREAESKSCPFAANMVLNIPTPTGPQIHTPFDPSSVKNNLCIASRCMAWRKHFEVKITSAFAVEKVPTDQGYCGLAGEP